MVTHAFAVCVRAFADARTHREATRERGSIDARDLRAVLARVTREGDIARAREGEREREKETESAMDGLELLLADGNDDDAKVGGDAGDVGRRVHDVCGIVVDGVDCAGVDVIDDATWDDVLNAFDAYCRDGAGEGVEEWTPPQSASSYASTHAQATRAVKSHITSVLRDMLSSNDDNAFSVAEDEDARETKRREARDAAKTIAYVRSRVNAYLRKHRATMDKTRINRLTMLRDMFVAEFRTFDERARDIERRTAQATTKKDNSHHLCLNLPDAGEIVRRRFETARVQLLDAFDASFKHVTSSAKDAAPKSSTSSASTTTKAASEISSETMTTTTTMSSESDATGRHTKHARKVLSAWLWDHFYPTDTRLKPIPTREEKLELARQTGLTSTQVGDWFVNARARLWKPYIEGLIRGTYNDAMVKKALDLQAEAA